ncbi:GGDEF domain-containing protein [Vibrio ostreicida]|uniref:GGDEF domain-containing protein n=1 Tax=Vibrio ostreicida TaxID=526588 RepID=UPI0009714B43|nr:diguanylate cyclase [Vibrio ostreicida]
MALQLLSSVGTVEKSVLKTTSLFLSLTGAGFTIVNFFIWDVPKFGYIDFAYTLLCLFIFSRIQCGHYKPVYSVLLIFGLSTVLIHSLLVAKGYSILVFWAFCLPPVFHILLNRYVGSALTLLFFVAVVFIFLSYPPLVHSSAHTTFNFAIPYILIWAIAFVHEDVRDKVQTQLNLAALTDPLTGARNRLCLDNDLLHRMEFLNQHFLLHIDLDHFKTINDTHGHIVGDKVLQAITTSILSHPDIEYFYRVGGEEFCVILGANNISNALSLANELRHNVEQTPVKHEENAINVRFSGGLSEFVITEGSIDLDATLATTDKALYQAKAKGRNQIVLSTRTEDMTLVMGHEI